MLRIYINHQDGTFFYKTGVFHAFMSLSLPVPTKIVKYVKNEHITFGSAINAARGAWYSPNDILFSSPHDSHHTRVCPVAIGHMVAEISGQDYTRLRKYLQFLCILLCGISRVKAMGKMPFPYMQH